MHPVSGQNPRDRATRLWLQLELGLHGGVSVGGGILVWGELLSRGFFHNTMDPEDAGWIPAVTHSHSGYWRHQRQQEAQLSLRDRMMFYLHRFLRYSALIRT